MPAVTYLSENEVRDMQTVKGDADLAELHEEVRRVTGKNYLIRSEWIPEHQRWMRKNIPEYWSYVLYLDIGHGEFQVINLRDTEERSGLLYSRRESAALITNYYLGILGGYEEAKRKFAEEIHRVKTTLNLFREFTIKNATQWQLGSNHHHPIWPYVADKLTGFEAPTSGADWKFIQPGNIIPREILQYQETNGYTDKNIPA